MTSDEPTAPVPSLDEQAMLYAMGTLQGELRTQLECCLRCPHSPVPALISSYTDLVGGLAQTTVPQAAPPPELKQQIMAAIRSRPRPGGSPAAPPKAPPPLQFIMNDELPWQPTPYQGVRLKELSLSSPEFAVVLIDVEPGGRFPEHDHHGTEDMYLLSGDLSIDGRLMRAGDYMHSEPGSHHPDMVSPQGCQAMIITSRKNYSRTALRAYGLVHRAISKVRGWLGAGQKAS